MIAYIKFLIKVTFIVELIIVNLQSNHDNGKVDYLQVSKAAELNELICYTTYQSPSWLGGNTSFIRCDGCIRVWGRNMTDKSTCDRSAN